MTTFVQLLMGIVITTMTFLVAVVGIQVFHILHEFRILLQKTNRILDNTQTLSEASAKPIAAVNEFFSEVKDLVNTTQDEIINQTPDRVIQPVTRTPQHISKSHFFRRSGLPLRPS